MAPLFQFLNNNPFIYFFLAIPFIVAAQVYYLVRKMSEPEKMFQPINAITPAEEVVLTKYQEWLRQTNLDYLCMFKFGSIRTVVYRQRDSQRFFSFYFHGARTTFCAETYFDDSDFTCLDTGTSGSIGMFPQRPHQYQQSFPNATPDIAWQRHLDAEHYLAGRFGIKMQSLSLPYEQILIRAMALRMQYVRSIPFYPFRALYWFAVSRGKMSNRSIQDQYSNVA